ncbi:hypothetical protein Tco_0926471, partial [Tanacetum coccineum]
KAILRTCKATRIIPVLILICVKFVFWLISLFSIQLRRQPVPNRDIRQYVLQPQDDMELSKLTLYYISKSVECSIQNAEKRQPFKLIELLENSKGFEGVKKLDSLPVQPSSGLDYLNC